MKRQLLLAALAAVLLSTVLPVGRASAQALDDSAATEDWFTACHWTGSEFRRISFPEEVEVPQWRIDEHRAHGDRWPGENVPGGDWPGYYFGADCEPVSWLIGVTFGACVTAAASPMPCFRPGPEGPGTSLVYDPSGTLFTGLTGVVQDPSVEFTTADGAVTADFDGDYLTVAVAPGQPELDFYFGFGPWDLFDVEQASGSTLPAYAMPGPGELLLRTASTQGATGPLVARYRLRLSHAYGFSEFRGSTITAEPAAIPADGVATATITVQLRNAVGEAPEGDPERIVDLFVDEAYGSIGPVIYLGEGRYVATYTAGTTAGTTEVFAQVDYLLLDLAVGTVTLTEVVPPLVTAAASP
ncbi:MAG: Ig-like domain-containing protein [Dehalococcoidia bacterium]